MGGNGGQIPINSCVLLRLWRAEQVGLEYRVVQVSHLSPGELLSESDLTIGANQLHRLYLLLTGKRYKMRTHDPVVQVRRHSIPL